MSGVAQHHATEGYKHTEVGIIPSDWEVSELYNLCERISVGLATSVTKYYRESGIPIVRNMNIKDGYFDPSDMLYLDPKFAKDNITKAAKAEDVITVHTGSNIGLTCVLPESFNKCQTFTTLITTTKKNRLSPYFLSFHMGSECGRSEINRLQVGGGKGNLNTGELKQYLFALPKDLAEQTAIANALSDVDVLITSLEKLIAKKRAIKTAAMQQLLTGKKRLPPFDQTHTGYKQTELGEIPTDWDVYSFSEIAGPKSSRTNPKMTGGGDFCIELEHVDQGTGTVNGSTLTTAESSLKNMFSEGDILFGKLRSYLRKYWLADRSGVCSTEIWVLKANDQRAIPQFIFQIVQTDSFIDCTSESYGTHMPRSDWKVVKSFLVATPSVDEQICISKLLSDMDKEIDALGQRLNKTQQLKQGMLQELLTGRTRLV